MWPWVTGTPLPKLERPPVVEVICGMHFPALDLDPVVVGAYWDQRRGDYPRRQLHPALEKGLARTGIVINAAPRMRVWLLSADESLVLQIQSDRFYLNWRQTKPNAPYPRFSGPTGLCARAMQELASFSEFCESAIGRKPDVDRVELGKVDHMLEGEAWNGLPDLSMLLPSLAPALSFSHGREPSATLRFQDIVERMSLSFVIDTTLTMAPGRDPQRGVRIDANVTMPLDGVSISSRFDEANLIANSVFAMLIPETERTRRFGAVHGG